MDTDNDLNLGEDGTTPAVKMMPVHVTLPEIRALNSLQGQQLTDPETGLRMYPLLAPLFEDDGVKTMFENVSTVMRQGNGEQQSELVEFVNQIDLSSPPNVEEIPSDTDPKIREISNTGEGPDKYLVLLPMNVVALFNLEQGENADPTLGLPGFGNWGNIFNSVVRLGATLVGAYFGGPMGAAAGNMLGNVATGNTNPKNLLIGGIKNYGYGAAANLAGGYMGWSGAAGTGQAFTASAPGSLQGMFGMGGSSAASSSIPGAAATATPASATATPASAIAGSSGGLMDTVAKWGPLAAIVGGGLLAGKGAQKEQETTNRKEEAKAEKANDRIEEHRRRAGYYDTITPINIQSAEEIHRQNPSPSYESDVARTRNVRAFKAGGLIGKPVIGKGGGQDDLIKVDTTKEGEWICDASLIADLGDGATDAGYRQIRKLEEHIASLPGFDQYPVLDGGKTPRNVKTALSNGEYRIFPRIVTAAGEGSNAKGAAILRLMTKEVRAYKNSNGTGLPPPIKDIMFFFYKAAKQVHKGMN